MRASWITVIAVTTAFASLLGRSFVTNRAHADEIDRIGSPAAIEIFPPQFRLDGKRQRLQLVVTAKYPDGETRDLTRLCDWTTADDSIADVESGRVTPRGDGVVEIRATAAGLFAGTLVEVAGQSRPDPISFHYETLPALSTQACNSGPCHGSPSGKGGFRLSLRAFDAELDRRTLLHESLGRRVDFFDPQRSLILLKPLGLVPHGGGKRLRRTDPAHDILHGWIASGCPLDPPSAPKLESIAVHPGESRELRFPANEQQLLVTARFSDGSTRDVTRLCVFTSSDEIVATVDAKGLVTGHDRGAIAIMARYLDRIETCHLTFVRDIPGFEWKAPAPANFIDDLVFAQLRKLQYTPSKLSSDDEFLRRVYLDVIGILPSIEESRAFLADESENKRTRLIDKLLARREFASFWAMKWADVLRLTKKSVSASGANKYHQWLVQSFARNEPYDEFARRIVTASGSTFANPAANFYRTATDAHDAAESTAQVFLGFRLACAKCHNHPFERWTQDNYYGMTAFFNRVKKKPGPLPDELVVYVGRSGEVVQPRTNQTMKPWLPLVGDAEAAKDDDRREALADWMTRTENPFFATMEVNRLWYHLLGRGIVDPVDDFRDSNPPSNAELLDALAREFRHSGFDRKHILRLILNSSVYQLSSTKNEFNRDDSRHFSHAYPRLLGAEQLLDAICHVTGVPESFSDMPQGTRATQLPSPDSRIEFLKVFGQPERQTVCQCERQSETSLSKALQMFNGSLLHEKLRDGKNRIRRAIGEKRGDAEILEELYLAALCRVPLEAELTAATRYLASKKNRETALEDICWAILNSNEFLFQH